MAESLSGSLQDCIEQLCPLLDCFWLMWQGSLLVITLGAIGSLAFERDGTIHQTPAFEISAVDSVGAGDAFASGLCVELCKQRPLAEALRYANACGALMASRLGVLDALPDTLVLQDFFKTQKCMKKIPQDNRFSTTYPTTAIKYVTKDRKPSNNVC